MVIRPATVQDIPQLLAIAEQSETAARWTVQQYETALTESRPRRVILVLGTDAVIGFAAAVEIAQEWELENIVVAPDQRGRGWGSKLLDAMFDSARESDGDSMFLEVRESNREARCLYENAGFMPVGRRPGYYHNPPEDAILYKKFLSASAPEIG